MGLIHMFEKGPTTWLPKGFENINMIGYFDKTKALNTF